MIDKNKSLKKRFILTILIPANNQRLPDKVSI